MGRFEAEGNCISRLDRGAVLVDVGAHLGDLSRLAIEMGHPAHLIYAIEPKAECLRRLSGLGVHVVHAAATDRRGTAAIYGDGELTSLRERDIAHLGIRHAFKETVPIIRLDLWAAEAGIDEIGFLKIDTEGADAEVLRGAAGLLERGRVGEIAFEVLDHNTHFVDGYQPSLSETLAVLGDGYELVEHVEAMYVSRRKDEAVDLNSGGGAVGRVRGDGDRVDSVG